MPTRDQRQLPALQQVVPAGLLCSTCVRRDCPRAFTGLRSAPFSAPLSLELRKREGNDTAGCVLQGMPAREPANRDASMQSAGERPLRQAVHRHECSIEGLYTAFKHQLTYSIKLRHASMPINLSDIRPGPR